MKKTIAVLLSSLTLSGVCLAEPISYGDNSGFNFDPPPPAQEGPKESGQEGPKDESVESVDMDKEKAEEGLPYEKTSVTERVPVYRDGKVVAYRSLKKKIRAVRQEREGRKGWHVTTAEEYVKYWHTTEHKKEPVVKVRTSERFYPDNEDGTHSVDPKEL